MARNETLRRIKSLLKRVSELPDLKFDNSEDFLKFLRQFIVKTLDEIDNNRCNPSRKVPRKLRLYSKKLAISKFGEFICGIIIIIANGTQAPPGIKDASITIGGVLINFSVKSKE